jgi:tungstate transport system ATP-binding protein
MAIAAELKGITKAFENRTALDSINLQIHEGEILALLGPNGSGKTTLLKILAFIENPTSGEVKFQGETISFKNVEKARLQSTLVFQKTTLFDTSVYNNVAYGLRIRKMPHNTRNEEVKKTLRLVKLEGFEKRPARKLSGGEQQRVAIARALTPKTKLLLLDEPTANLDPKNAQIVEEAIATANREQKTTIVMATHNMFQAKTLPQRIALMSEGRITEVGTPAEIFGKLSKNLASFAAVENTYLGMATAAENGTTLVDIGNGVQVEASIRKHGSLTIFVSPQDIILSRTRLESSARNCFKGRIVEILDSGPLVRLRVDVGRPFTAQITKRSFSEMGLNLNSEVFLTFKASSVQTI